MNRVAHIVWKDARAIGVPILAWLLMLAVQTIGFATYHALPDYAASLNPSQIFDWLSERRELEDKFLPLIQGLDLCLAALLMYQLVAADAVTGTQAFWRTRPIASERLFVAKVSGILLFFFVAPLLALAATWFGLGFSIHDVALAARSLWWPMAGTVIVSFGIAALCRHAAGFVFAGVLWLGVYFLCQIFNRGDDYREIRAAFALVWLLSAGVVARLQFAFPWSRRTWLVLVVGVLAMVAIDWQRPAWAATVGETMRPPRIVRGPQTVDEERIKPRIAGFDSQSSVISVSAPAANDDHLLATVVGGATYIRGTHDLVRTPWSVAPNWGQTVAIDFLQSHPSATGDWRLHAWRSQVDGRQFDPARVHSADWFVAWMKPEKAWEVLARAGAAARHGSERAEIQYLRFNEEGCTCFLSERWPAEDTTDRTNNHRVDVYVLVGADGAGYYPADILEVRAFHLNAVAVVSRQLRFRIPPAALTTEFLGGAKLVKVEFTREGEFETYSR